MILDELVLCRSVNWVCPTCGAANRSILVEEEEEQKGDKKESEEIANIVSQMVIKVRGT